MSVRNIVRNVSITVSATLGILALSVLPAARAIPVTGCQDVAWGFILFPAPLHLRLAHRRQRNMDAHPGDLDPGPQHRHLLQHQRLAVRILLHVVLRRSDDSRPDRLPGLLSGDR